MTEHRFKVCGCFADEPCDEARHQRNAEKAATALGWSHHERDVAVDLQDNIADGNALMGDHQ